MAKILSEDRVLEYLKEFKVMVVSTIAAVLQIIGTAILWYPRAGLENV